jgi:REP element-mobilizing transposase RayT
VRTAGVSPAGSKPAIFRAFDEHADLDQSRRNLPHWEQHGATYFVTFRLADSVPASLRAEWREELDRWLAHHPKPWDSPTAFEYHERFVQSREDWLDRGHGSCLLRDPAAAQTVADALRHFDGDRYVLDAFVVMPNHVHALVQPAPAHSLSDLLHSWKSFTARKLGELRGEGGTVWQDESFDRIVRNWEELQEYRSYIRRNPEKARLGLGEYVLEVFERLLLDDSAGETPAVRTAGTAVVRHDSPAER